jgi:hypothetical protein
MLAGALVQLHKKANSVPAATPFVMGDRFTRTQLVMRFGVSRARNRNRAENEENREDDLRIRAALTS